MKKGLIFLALTLISTTSKSQKRGDNQILVHGTSLKTVMSTFMDAGYTIDKYDTVLGTTSTVTRKVTNKAYTIIWRVRIKDSIAIITGDWMSIVSMSIGGAKIEPTYYPLDYRTSSLNEMHSVFLDMVALAKKMGPIVDFAKVEP